MWSLAIRSPKLLVSPRSSSLSAHLPAGHAGGRVPADAARAAGPGPAPSRRIVLSTPPAVLIPMGGQRQCYLGSAGELTVTLPEMMSCLSWSTSVFRSAGTLLSNWLYGAIC